MLDIFFLFKQNERELWKDFREGRRRVAECIGDKFKAVVVYKELAEVSEGLYDAFA